MTAASSQKLVDALRRYGLEGLAERAATDEFHDYLSNHAMPANILDTELYQAASNPRLSEAQRAGARLIRMQHHDGEFDATTEESDDWADSEAGRDTFRRLTKGE